MHCDVSIDFEVGDFALPRLLTRIESEGYLIRALAMAPLQHGQSRLTVELESRHRGSALHELAAELMALQGTLRVLDQSAPLRAAG